MNVSRILQIRTVVAAHLTVEERCGRHLLLVTDDDDLLRPHNGAHGVRRAHLAGLVDQEQIEFQLAGREVLCYRQGAHEEDGLNRHHGIRGGIEELAQAHVARLLVGFSAHNPDHPGRAAG